MPLEPNKDRLRLWVQALRDPRYFQTTGGLREGNTYCCLGVACEVYKAATGDGTWAEDGDYVDRQFETFTVAERPDMDPEVYEFTASDQAMPTPVHHWFGLDSPDPDLQTSGEAIEMRNASYLNDNSHWSFTQIADAITKTFELEKPDEPGV